MNPSVEEVMNLDDLSDNDLITTVIYGIAKRLKSRKGKFVVDNTSTKSIKKKTMCGASKVCSKWVPPFNKRKIREHVDSEYDVEDDVHYISPMKRPEIKKLSARVPNAILDNILFHSVDSVEQWKYVYQRRIALEREMGKDVFECHEIMEIISYASLMKTVTGFGKCYEGLVKEFIINIHGIVLTPRVKSLGKCIVRKWYLFPFNLFHRD